MAEQITYGSKIVYNVNSRDKVKAKRSLNALFKGIRSLFV